MANKPSMQRWIDEALTDTDKDGPIRAITLIHYVGTAERELHTVKFGSKQWAAADLAKLFRGKAETYCAEMPGLQQFALFAFYGTSGESQGTYPFGINGQQDFGGLATEGPHGTGLVQQAMRHTEAMVQMAYRQTATMSEASMNMIKVQGEIIERLISENHAVLEIAKATALERQNDRLKELEYQRQTAERAKLLSYAPMLINNILGRSVFPEPVADTAVIEALIDNMSAADLERLSQAVPPAVWGPLAERFTQLLIAKRERAESTARAFNGKNPEDDAAGD